MLQQHRTLLQFLLVVLLSTLAIQAEPLKEDGILWTTLSDGSKFPVVGFGVGNLQHDLIADRVRKAISDDTKTIMIDTAHASRNEGIIREGIVRGLKESKAKEIHVVTKVWYTHLGYNRTVISVKESLEALKHPNIKVHILIHWPRCNDAIPWMNCLQEEEDLPDEVKKAGRPPHEYKESAFLDSWAALEDIYMGKINLGSDLPKVASIGVSNFAMEDFKKLETTQRMSPHILQGNIWSYLFDPNLINYCKEKQILFQAYNAVNGVFYDRTYEDAPNAIHALNFIKEDQADEKGEDYSLPQLVFKWLLQNDVSVVPRTSSEQRLVENSAVVLAKMPELSNLEQGTIRSAVAALLSKEDMKPPLAEWVNRAEKGLISIFWVHADTGEEIPVMENLKPGESYNAFTQRGHKFVVYHDGKKVEKEMVVHAWHGQRQRFDIQDEQEL